MKKLLILTLLLLLGLSLCSGCEKGSAAEGIIQGCSFKAFNTKVPYSLKQFVTDDSFALTFNKDFIAPVTYDIGYAVFDNGVRSDYLLAHHTRESNFDVAGNEECSFLVTPDLVNNTISLHFQTVGAGSADTSIEPQTLQTTAILQSKAFIRTDDLKLLNGEEYVLAGYAFSPVSRGIVDFTLANFDQYKSIDEAINNLGANGRYYVILYVTATESGLQIAKNALPINQEPESQPGLQ